MFVEAIQSVEKALFPIIRKTEHSPTSGKVTVSITGCGFFVDDRGTFASVAHAFDDPPPNSKYFFIGRLPGQLIWPGMEITEVARDDKGDVFLGRVAIETPSFLALSRDVVSLGKSICVSGYPLPQIKLNPLGGFDFSGVRPRYRSTMVIDRTVCSVERGRVQQAVLVQDPGLFGVSGGAVVDVNGMAVGMMGSVTTQLDSIGANGNRKITVENGVIITSDQIATLYDKALGLRTVVPCPQVASEAVGSRSKGLDDVSQRAERVTFSQCPVRRNMD